MTMIHSYQEKLIITTSFTNKPVVAHLNEMFFKIPVESIFSVASNYVPLKFTIM